MPRMDRRTFLQTAVAIGATAKAGESPEIKAEVVEGNPRFSIG